MTGNNRLDSINVLNPRSVQRTFLYRRCSIEDPEIRDSGGIVPLVVNSDTKQKKTTLNQHAVIILQRFDHHSLHCSCCFHPLSIGLVSFLGNAFLVHIAARSRLSRLVALVRLLTFNASHHQSSSANELFSLEQRPTRV